jgi:hypothetical protein
MDVGFVLKCELRHRVYIENTNILKMRPIQPPCYYSYDVGIVATGQLKFA